MNKLYYNYNFSIGFNDKDTQQQKIDTKTIQNIIENQTMNILGFGTITYNHKGVWTYENGNKGVEFSANVNRKTEELNQETVNKFTKTLKKLLNQESILVSYTRERVNFA